MQIAKDLVPQGNCVIDFGLRVYKLTLCWSFLLEVCTWLRLKCGFEVVWVVGMLMGM